MLTRIYIDNYKTFVNFEFHPQKLQLILGKNGAGKSALFEVLERLRDFMLGSGIESKHLFPAASLTAWDRRARQTFELDIHLDGQDYRYRLVIEHDDDRLTNRIQEERVELEQNPLYIFDGQDVHLYNDSFNPGAMFPFDGTRSALATIPERKDNRLLTIFQKYVRNILLFTPNPLTMESFSEAEQFVGDKQMKNIISWLRHLSQSSDEFKPLLTAYLRDGGFAGLQGMPIDPISDRARFLRFVFSPPDRNPKSPYSLLLHQISDGQRQLLALYTILLGAVNDRSTVCVDEPDNYVALTEIQPWLIELSDRVEESSAQCFLISHHPETLNYLAAENGVVFTREEGGPTRVSKFGHDADELMTPAEYVARGGK